MLRLLRARLAFAILLFSFSSGGDAAVVEKAPRAGGLFLDVPAPDTPVKVRSTVTRRRVVTMDLPALRARKGVGARLQFNLFADANFEGVVEDLVERRGDDFTLTGRLDGDQASTFALAVKDGVSVMNIRTERTMYQLRHLGESFYDVRQVDASSYPTCGTTAKHSGAGARVAHRVEPNVVPKGAKADSGATIDVMVVYTPASRTNAGGTAAMHALVNLAVDESNAAYQRSQITPRLRLVHQQEINYTESGSFNTDLDRLTAPNDGHLDQVHTLRNTYGADMVSLFIEDDEYCGLAWLMTTLSASFEDSAFSIVWWDCATGLYTFAHELGHNMGCAHDRQNASAGLYSFSYGWRFATPGNITNRTIMAYSPGLRIQNFSNPNVLYNGVATGVPEGQANAANNALTINNAAFTVANWRQQVVTCTYGIFPASTNVPSSAAFTGTINISVSSNNCAWSAVSQSPFITIAGPTNGTGNGSISYSVTTNSSPDSRTGHVFVAGQFFTVVQSGNAPTISLAEAVDLPGHAWALGGNGNWFGQSSVTKDGTDAARSGAITHNEESYVQAVFYGPGKVSFWWKVGSESGYDFLHLLVNGVTNQSISGIVDWQFRTITLTNGPHLVRWTYSKDSSLNQNGDAAWLDLVQPSGQPYFTNGLSQLNGNRVRLQVHGRPSSTVIMQSSTNLTAWSAIATNTFSPAGLWVFTNSVPGIPKRYYRALEP